MKHLLLVPSLLLASLFLAACDETADSGDARPEVAAFAPPAPPPTKRQLSATADASTPLPVERKLIKNGAISFIVDDLAATAQRLAVLIEEHEGYVAAEDTNTYDDDTHVNLTVRVPAERFDGLLEAIAAASEEVTHRSVDVQDVTLQYVDLETRLRVKKELEERYLALLEQATNVEELLGVQRELAAVREDIEAAEAQFQALRHQVSYATLRVSYRTERLLETSFLGELWPSLAAGWDNLLGFLLGLLRLWPFLLGAAGLIALWRLRRRRRKSLHRAG